MSKRSVLLSEMLKNDPNDSFLNYAIALECIKDQNITEAIAIMEKIMAQDKNYLAVYYQLGKLYEMNNEAEKAVTIYRQGIEIARQREDVRTLGELEEALMIIDEL